MMNYWGNGWENGYWPMMGLGVGGGLVMIIFWILIIALIFTLIRRAGGRGGWYGDRYDKTPLDILKERYARGEMNKAEYEERKRDLM